MITHDVLPKASFVVRLKELFNYSSSGIVPKKNTLYVDQRNHVRKVLKVDVNTKNIYQSVVTYRTYEQNRTYYTTLMEFLKWCCRFITIKQVIRVTRARTKTVK